MKYTNDPEHTKKYNQDKRTRFSVRVIGNIFFIFVGMLVCYYLIYPHWAVILKNCMFVNVEDLTNEEMTMISNLVGQNKIHTIDFVVSNLISFYETQIQCVIGLFAIFGFLGFVYIKSSHQRDIIEEIQSYFNSNSGNILLKNIVENCIKDEKIKPIVAETFNKERNDGIISDMSDELTELKGKTEQLSEIVTNISDRLDSTNPSESLGEINFQSESNEEDKI